MTEVSSPVHVERLHDGNRAQTLAFLDGSPYENAFLAHLALGNSALERCVRIAFEGGEVAGVAFVGEHIVLASRAAAVPQLAACASGDERAIVGPRETVRAYWSAVRGDHAPPRLVRDRQPVMAVERGSLVVAGIGRIRVRPARDNEWAAVAGHSAAMISGEIGADARGELPEFGAGIRRMIRLGLWWVGESNAELCFFCNIGAWSERTAQLQGIWTPPDLRGRGLATAALGAICRTLLRTIPSLSLYVNESNAPARALYTRLGFRDVGELQTMFF